MAVRQRRTSLFAGGVSRWVSVEEARRLAREVGRLRTFGDLAGWLEAAPDDVQSATGIWGIRLRRADSDQPLESEPASGHLATTLIADLASVRRDAAVRTYAIDHGLDPDIALRDPRRTLCRCPRCEAASDAGLYCWDCKEAEAAEIETLISGRGGMA